MRWTISSLIVAGLFALSQAHAGSASGTYVGSGHNAAFMIQLVEGDRGNVNGRYVQVLLSPQGKVVESNSSITGTIDGETIVVTLKPTELLSGNITASGAVNSSELRLSGGGYGGTLTLHLSKTDEAKFQGLVAALSAQSQQIADAKVKAEFLAQVKTAISKVEELSNKIRIQKDKMEAASIVQRYRSATEWMRNAQARQSTILGGGQASVARSQIGVSINQTAIQVENFHSEIKAAQGSFQIAVETLGKNNAGPIRDCNFFVTDAAPAPTPETKAACIGLDDSLKVLGPRVRAQEAAFQAAESIWSEERRKQDQILRASEYASR